MNFILEKSVSSFMTFNPILRNTMNPSQVKKRGRIILTGLDVLLQRSLYTLTSLNKESENIEVKPDQPFYIVGRVLN